MAVALVVTMAVYPFILRFARRHGILDNPNARKLQRAPVPVMGGATVMVGVLVAMILCYIITGDARVMKILLMLAVMFLLGFWDDLKDVSATFRFIAEIVVIWLIMLLLDVEINNLHGLWGIREIPDIVAIPLSIITGVGIINAVNMIDGVDGYCSSFGIMSCLAFALVFYLVSDKVMVTIAIIGIGAMIPFFFHNVFGASSKMFLGDGGSLMLGTLLTVFTFTTLSSNSACARYDRAGLSLVALTLAIMAVPVFDTLKVMCYRIARNRSPFQPDKTHLHHLFIDMNYSHLATSATIVLYNFLIFVVLVVAWFSRVPKEWQVYIVVFMALMFTWVFYFAMEWDQRKMDRPGFHLFRWISERHKIRNASQTAIWLFIRRVVDSKALSGKSQEEGSEEQKRPKIDPRV